MADSFNPLDFEQLVAHPKRLHKLSAWNEHVPFAMFLVELQRPHIIVELGTHWGVSYLPFCQAVAETGIETRCYAVDTWAGDTHAGHYGNNVYENLKRITSNMNRFRKCYGMTFDEALRQVPCS